MPLFTFFGGKCRSKGRFWDPWKIENRSKTALLSENRHLGPLKMVSGRGSRKNMKNQWKMDPKMNQKSCKSCPKMHWKIDTFSNLRFLVFCKESYVKIRFLQNQGYRKFEKMMKKRCKNEGAKKSKNRCQKGPQKSCFLVQNRASSAPGSIDCAIRGVFGDVGKSLIFRCRFGSSKNR